MNSDTEPLCFTENEASSSNLLEFLLLCGKLKETKRKGWVDHHIRYPESVSDHMYRMALFCFCSCPNHLNRDKLVKLALVHDLGESLVGDITPHDGISPEEKNRKEAEAFRKIRDEYLSSCTVGQELYDLWNEYENNLSEEAKFVKQVDKLEMLIQAFEYERGKNDWFDRILFLNAWQPRSTYGPFGFFHELIALHS
ncbi:putative hydrolase of HD superfamily isoform 2 [Galdieria sulphuraria]|uniref:5'-deoxynucleotidase n=1 Tax=Galdieria sulphuraria TaxID=130081 RepID=M2WT10_GALSU|nr:putative hydrolase of HD superfamily isoform 2 [Galdieria sulphuraria]EME27030.1 putative hydrolase of HD superfamily isoform 2 [Galdieria sulphuraria]|eukprot:XP_005703550.1 putative hydrolase of HD superfamily isoform 2 [Galdieria sulphuraria]